MSQGITIDWREFDKAMVEYAAASGKDFADITNKKLGDVALRAAQFSDKASKEIIANIYSSKSWWPKFIQKVISLGFNIHGRRKAVGDERFEVWIDTPTGQKRGHKKTVGYDRKAGRSYADAVRVSKRIIKRRIATVGMFKAVFGIASLKCGKFTTFGNKYGPVRVADSRKGRDFVFVKPATPADVSATFEIPFKNNKAAWAGGSRPSASADVSKKVSLGYKFLQRGVDFVASDMDAYTERKMQETARRYSAK